MPIGQIKTIIWGIEHKQNDGFSKIKITKSELTESRIKVKIAKENKHLNVLYDLKRLGRETSPRKSRERSCVDAFPRVIYRGIIIGICFDVWTKLHAYVHGPMNKVVVEITDLVEGSMVNVFPTPAIPFPSLRQGALTGLHIGQSPQSNALLLPPVALKCSIYMCTIRWR